MGIETAISWCDHTFNPWWGCVKVSPACQHCYAETFSKRVGQKVWGIDAPRRFFGAKHWSEPLKWNAAAVKAGVRRRVFCASMADVFEDRADLVAARGDLFILITETPALDWLILTKRPENIARLMPKFWSGKPWPNVWYGTTAENQPYADERIPHLLRVEAAVRFVSVEPMLGHINLDNGDTSWLTCTPKVQQREGGDCCMSFMEHGKHFHGIDWVIAGGESGPKNREPEADWFLSLRDQCVRAGVAFHFKQWGGLHAKTHGRLLDGREWLEFPKVSI